jgi:hypothetical protein
MDKDRVAGSAKQTKGSVNEAISKVQATARPRLKGLPRRRQVRRRMPLAASRTRCATPPSSAD